MSWFDESRLDDELALGAADLRLRTLAESGARVRREAGDADQAIAEVVARSQEQARPRAVIAAGPDSRLLRAVLEPWCPVPFVAWPGQALPGWAGSLDLVVVLAPDGGDTGTASAVAEAVRRGCQVVAACPPGSIVAEHAAGRWSTILPTTTSDQLATAVVMLTYLHQIGLGPSAPPEEVAESLDAVATACSPHRDLAVNPAKMLAIALADANPLVWGGSVLAARAARRVAESIRRASGRTALAGDAEHLLPVIEAARPRDVFDDPFSDDGGELRPMLLVLDDGADDIVLREHRGRLRAAADQRGVRVETVSSEAGCEVARYASLLLSGTYASEYLRLGLIEG
ncbi:bifunctional glucose-6-phosphate/mannose-6-phosphate isomerase [Nocardioides szechwanensis]|uniref:Phospho-glucose isomerase C-terminal SIS domain-containing protein n=1 Tax=Nocardioides szechwanensis TaxID=1005944 RepID=A0A1H0L719_9ACTN|nr:SIS domain-containing protein [Nocardioides szechwanensis]GEP35620.1 bifunctional glucose-6-phosphate/mannose-6-phosphate isomerase [Nocardioides szechwanensis]SDO63750.1 phospho-glucose isomerase C-terminal SIS domain-containing protein [Nocardioides szechwanensis]